jgi:hypothetical protein
MVSRSESFKMARLKDHRQPTYASRRAKQLRLDADTRRTYPRRRTRATWLNTMYQSARGTKTGNMGVRNRLSDNPHHPQVSKARPCCVRRRVLGGESSGETKSTRFFVYVHLCFPAADEAIGRLEHVQSAPDVS